MKLGYWRRSYPPGVTSHGINENRKTWTDVAGATFVFTFCGKPIPQNKVSPDTPDTVALVSCRSCLRVIAIAKQRGEL